MSKKRTYIDASLLIAAWRGQGDIAEKATAILEDPERALVVSDALWLEVMPKPLHHQQHEECGFYEAVFAAAERSPWQIDVLYQAHDLAQRYGMAAMDAIHVATAIAAEIDEFVSGEKQSKPMFQVRELTTVSLRGS
jgi:predicted nucleic acid-binding protein